MEREPQFTDTHFFTNEEGMTLSDRFSAILRHDTDRFDVIVGYFYVTGFYKLWKALENVEKIRIIVGMGTDEETLLLTNSNNVEDIEGTKELIDKIKEKIQREFENADTTLDIDEGIDKFLEYIKTGKLEIRGYPSKKLHAKVYIMIKKKGSEDYGKVITGSSNFTISGLSDNLEFNVELKDYADVKFAEEKFEELWSRSVPLSEDFVKVINNDTYRRRLTPYEIYLKTLYEYFQDRIDFDLQRIDLPPNIKKFRFQVEAALQLKEIVNEHGGAFLSDVVGLGKTYIASTLASLMEERRPLVICPPELTEYWENTMEVYDVYPKVVSLGMLASDNFNVEEYRRYNLVFIDEAHRFRNELSKSYDVLHEVVSGKKVVLITATPLNNTPKDIANQIYLFEDKFNSTIPGLKNLKAFFDNIEKEYKSLKERQKTNDITEKEFDEISNKISNKIRQKVLDHIMVRRTRRDILKYFEDDIKERNLKFPEVKDPKPIYYELDEKLNSLFEESVKVIASRKDEKRLTYAAYTPFRYISADGINELIRKGKFNESQIEFQQRSENFLAGLMKVLFLKRLDSSFYAFKESLKNMIKRYNFLIEKFDKEGVVLYAETDKLMQKLENKQIDEDEIQEIVQNNSLDAKYFHKQYREDLEKDRKHVEELLKKWENINYDPKIQKIVSILKNDEILSKEKVIIFTEFQDTLDYLESELSKVDALKGKFIAVSSKTDPITFDKAIRNFDRRHKHHENNFRILIGTDVLAEGLNLDDAKAVVNFDIPWNPTRIIQRFGRINRIDTPGEIYIYNFFPAESTEKEIHLKDAASRKIALFINTLGADSKYLTEFDPSNSSGIFTLMNSKKLIEEFAEEENEELKYLDFIRKIRDSNRNLFEKIKHLPLKSRAARRGDVDKVITFFKIGKLPKFYLSTKDETKEVSPLEAIREIECDKDEKSLEIKPFFYEMFARNENAFKDYLKKEDASEYSTKHNPTEKKIIAKIKAIEDSIFDDVDRYYLSALKDAVKLGALSRRRIIKATKEIENLVDSKKIVEILKKHLSPDYVYDAVQNNNNKKERKVILSSIFEEGV